MIFGSTAYMHIPKQFRRKLDAKSKRVLFVGYEGDSEIYRIYDSVSRTVKVLRDVYFNENGGNNNPDQNTTDDDEHVNLFFENPDEATMLDKRDNKENEERDEADEVFASVNGEEEPHDIEPEGNKRPVNGNQRELRERNKIKPPLRFQTNVAEFTPLTYREAVNDPEPKQWQKAIKEEIVSHEKNQTWKLVSRNSDMRPID